MNSPVLRHDLSDADYLRFSALVHARSGLEIPLVRRPDLERAVVQAMAELSISSPEALFNHLRCGETSNATLETLIARVTVGETHFFRNRPQFEALEWQVLPKIIEKRRPIRQLRLWSAGCATGEEPYSLSILLMRLLPDIADWNILILATDINRLALEKAQRGLYSSWSFREVPYGIQENYFTHQGKDSFEIKPAVRNRVTFAYLNLVEDNYPSILTNTQAMDLILCRNVLIYFDEITNRKVVERFHASLDETGWLVVGHAEPSQAVFHQFSVRNFPGAILYQKPEVENPAPGAPLSVEPAPFRFDFNPLPESPPIPVLPARPVMSPPAPVAAGPGHPVGHLHKLPPPPPEIQSAMALYEAGRLDQALQQLTAQAQANPNAIWPPYLIAKLYANRREFKNAEPWIDRVLVLEPLMAPAHYLRGLILQELGRLDQSLTAFRACVYADPQFLLGHFSLARLLGRLGQSTRALKTLQNLEELLTGQKREALVPDGDGLTIGRLAEFVSAQKELLK
jgi:chemotaxis protein methyltransferase CheR